MGMGSANFMEMQQQLQSELMGNPEMLRQMMDNPMVQQLMSNPDVMRQLITNNPQMRELMEVGGSLVDWGSQGECSTIVSAVSSSALLGCSLYW